MGDDCFDNSGDYAFDNQATWEEIMPVIKENYFLASVSGNDVVWVLQNSKKEEIIPYFTFKDIIIRCTTKTLLPEICDEVYELHFKYYSSPSKRGEYIENINDNSQYNMWHDGWIEEYNLCK
jgi:hypothetical protein